MKTAQRINRHRNASSTARSKAHRATTIEGFDWIAGDGARTARQIAMHARREQDRHQSCW